MFNNTESLDRVLSIAAEAAAIKKLLKAWDLVAQTGSFGTLGQIEEDILKREGEIRRLSCGINIVID